MFSPTVLRTAALVALSLTPLCAAIFDFESVPLGTTTTFSDSQGGITATFRGAPASFGVSTGFFSTLTGQILLDADSDLNTLSITFSHPLSSLSLVFALNNSRGFGKLTLTAYTGGLSGTVAGSVSASGMIPSGFILPEGSLTFSGPAFDAVTLQSDQRDFAIDNLTVRVASGPEIPEPATLGLLLAGLAGSLAWRRRG